MSRLALVLKQPARHPRLMSKSLKRVRAALEAAGEYETWSSREPDDFTGEGATPEECIRVLARRMYGDVPYAARWLPALCNPDRGLWHYRVKLPPGDYRVEVIGFDVADNPSPMQSLEFEVLQYTSRTLA